jgi:hypothetical protein
LGERVSRIRQHIRTNVVGYVALLAFATAGTAGALPGDNRVGSGDIKDGAVGTTELDREAVTAKKLAPRSIRGQHFPDVVITSRAIADSAFAAGDISRSGGKSGDAFEITPNAITSGEINNGTIGAADVDEHGIGLGSSYAERTSSLQLGSSFQTVVSRSVETTAPTQLNAVATIGFAPDAVLDGEYGAVCTIEVDGLLRSPDYIEEIDELEWETVSLAFGRTLFPGSHTIALRCRKFGDPGTDIGSAGLTIFAVPLS